ncbi:hypothetical protein BDI4_410051 [Burkholderia diffusa]|nr:hypothetical protein BDI4_410051 [Burkholderia diffusa]
MGECQHDRVAQFINNPVRRTGGREHRELDIGQGRQAGIRGDRTQAVRQLCMHDWRHRKARVRGGAQAGATRAHEHDPVIHARAGQCCQRGLTIRARFRQQRDRHRYARRERRPIRTGPHKRLAPEHASGGPAVAASTHHHIQLAVIQRLEQFARDTDSDAERDARVPRGKRLHHVHQPDIGEVFRQTHADRACTRFAQQLRPSVLIEREDGARVTQQQFAVHRERDRARGAHEQVTADLFFQAPKVRADGGLRQIQTGRGMRESAFLDDGHERAQQNGIEHEMSRNTVRMLLNNAMILRLYFESNYVLMRAVNPSGAVPCRPCCISNRPRASRGPHHATLRTRIWKPGATRIRSIGSTCSTSGRRHCRNSTAMRSMPNTRT